MSLEVEDHLDIEKVMQHETEKLLKIARLQGQWTSTKSIQHQAELLHTEGPIIQQFVVALERIETRLKKLGATRDQATDE